MKPLIVISSAAKKVVAILKGTSNVEGVVTLTQEDDGQLHLSLPFTNYILEYSKQLIWRMEIQSLRRLGLQPLFPPSFPIPKSANPDYCIQITALTMNMNRLKYQKKNQLIHRPRSQFIG